MSEIAVTLSSEHEQTQHELQLALIEAIGRQDEVTAIKLHAKIKWPAWGLKAGKKLFGAEFLREQQFNTELADKKYGSEWLNNEEV